MKELTLDTMIAVFEEVLGPGLFWALFVAAVLIGLAYIYVLIRDRAVNWRRFLLAQLSMPIGALVAVLFTLYVTNSSIVDIGGPVDVLVLLAVASAGACGMAVLVYTVQALLMPPSRGL